ncbi:MAG: hypothetical protein ACRYF2_26635 [Janthinobacterium lividum]
MSRASRAAVASRRALLHTVRSAGLLLLFITTQWIGQHVSVAFTGPTTVPQFLTVARWDALILFAACFVVGLAVQRIKAIQWSEWAVTSLAWLWLGRYGNPDANGPAVFFWSYLSVPAMVAGLAGALLVARRHPGMRGPR